MTRRILLLMVFVDVVCSLQNQLISSPFDNFRIECAKSSGAVRISVRMVGSQGFIRQDIVFGIVCERVDELYPWYGIPMGIMEMEREDCYYSQLFDPIVDTESLYTCRAREYISGITRLSDTRVQVLCCRLRTRDEANCEEKQFSKPIGSDPRTEIFHGNKLINSVAVEGHSYRVRFCDSTPRAIGLIYEDVPTTTTTAATTEIPKLEQSTASDTVPSKITTAAVRRKAHTKNGRRKILQTTEWPATATKRVIRVFRPSALYSFGEEDQRTWDMDAFSSARNSYPKGMQPYSQKDIRNKHAMMMSAGTTTQRTLPTIPPNLERDYQVDDRGLLTGIDSLLEAQQASERAFLSVVLTDRTTVGERQNTDSKPSNISKQNFAQHTMLSASGNFTQGKHNTAVLANQQVRNHSTPEQANSNIVRASTTETIRASTASTARTTNSTPRTTTSASLLLLKPLNSKAKGTEVTIDAKTNLLLQQNLSCLNKFPKSKFMNGNDGDDEIEENDIHLQQQTTKTDTKTMHRVNEVLSAVTSAPTMKTTSRTTSHLTRFSPPMRTSSVFSKQLYGASTKGGYIDEETNYSPFENGDNIRAHDNEALEPENSVSPTTGDPLDMILTTADDLPYEISNEIRRAPVRPPRKQIGAAYSEFKWFPNVPTNKLENEFSFPTFGDENTEGIGADYTENDIPMKKSADGSRTYVPEDQERMKAPSLDEDPLLCASAAVMYSANKHNVPEGATDSQEDELENDQKENDVEGKLELSSWNDDGEEELLPMNDYEMDNITTDTQTASSLLPSSTTVNEQKHLKISSTNFSQQQTTETRDAKELINLARDIENQYDPVSFYHTPQPKRPLTTGKVLTFCTKEIAVRDRHDLVIACGSETEIWRPFRCPPGSECFLSSDSSYRICCAVAEAARYAH